MNESGTAPPRAEEIAPNPTRREDAREADVVATWFARTGALALLVGAGFGYRYAVDRGLIGPGGRVALGVLAAIALVLAGEWTAARGWRPFAQAVSGGGIGLFYVTTWAAFHEYGLIDARVAFALLGVIAVGGGLLALRHDSQALAVLATFGAFANPVVVEGGSIGTPALLGYVLALDVCVLGLAYFRNWEVLNWVAAAGSWSSLGFGSAEPTRPITIAYISAYQLIFVATATLNAIRERGKGQPTAAFLAVNSFLYVLVLVALMTPEYSEWRGAALGGLAAAYLGLGFGLWKANVRGVFLGTTVAIGAVLAIIWVPVQLHDHWVPAIWAAEGAAAVFAGYALPYSHARTLGCVMMVASASITMITWWDGSIYDPATLFLSTQSLAYVVQTSALFAGAFALLRYGEGDERHAGILFVVVANALTLVYVSLEASAYVTRTYAVPARAQMLQFAYTIVWSAYACALVAVGVVRNSRLLRYLGVGLFGATVLKLVVSDVWLLSTGYRTLVFVGVGLLLLACSLMYSRFKELVLDDRRSLT